MRVTDIARGKNILVRVDWKYYALGRPYSPQIDLGCRISFPDR